MDMLDQYETQLRKLAQKKIRIVAEGNYPNQKRTPVQSVCTWQNDGNGRGVVPAKFVEAAEEKADGWDPEISRIYSNYIDGVDILQDVANKIADDIYVACNRIRTGRLKLSFRGRVL